MLPRPNLSWLLAQPRRPVSTSVSTAARRRLTTRRSRGAGPEAAAARPRAIRRGAASPRVSSTSTSPARTAPSPLTSASNSSVAAQLTRRRGVGTEHPFERRGGLAHRRPSRRADAGTDSSRTSQPFLAHHHHFRRQRPQHDRVGPASSRHRHRLLLEQPEYGGRLLLRMILISTGLERDGDLVDYDLGRGLDHHLAEHDRLHAHVLLRSPRRPRQQQSALRPAPARPREPVAEDRDQSAPGPQHTDHDHRARDKKYIVLGQALLVGVADHDQEYMEQLRRQELRRPMIRVSRWSEAERVRGSPRSIGYGKIVTRQ